MKILWKTKKNHVRTLTDEININDVLKVVVVIF